ncbi:hypothetical protein [Mycobacterium paragordonae]|uniref:Uncharacterized protein n=1 Tax=Mycobacterium paragordonae TaxID=1389713 RepID=A0AAJ1W258_9MYCO|nr:hypothetical protein [Mycobacterium paragordonae]MDP7733669.1 hypothetical protein [Mycobacterium paragordonae]
MQFNFVVQNDKWQIRKKPLWDGYPLEWQVVPPLDDSNGFNIQCFRTGAQAIAYFIEQLLDIEQGWH